MEQGRPRVEFALVLRVIGTLGLEMSIRRASDDPPAWTKPITREALARQARLAANRAHAKGVRRRRRGPRGGAAAPKDGPRPNGD